MLAWFEEALGAVDPRKRTAETLEGRHPVTVIALGKAAPAMTMGAADALGPITGLCVADAEVEVPPGIGLLVGDHPVPGQASFDAGRKVLEAAKRAGSCIALISGGGSALCEHPLPGIPPEFVVEATRALLVGGASIGETNQVRAHLSAIKSGGLARAILGNTETLILSDVGSLGPEFVASGPTLSRSRDPDGALDIMVRCGIAVPPQVAETVRSAPAGPVWGPVEVVADGRDAAEGLAASARLDGLDARVADGWLEGPLSDCLSGFISDSGPGVTVAAGEPTVEVAGEGRGGRNAHAALQAASMLAGGDALFAALATDGVDGNSGGGGAVVDGATVSRGGDPTQALASFDSASYLERTGDLVATSRTGTNVADLWVMWRP